MNDLENFENELEAFLQKKVTIVDDFDEKVINNLNRKTISKAFDNIYLIYLSIFILLIINIYLVIIYVNYDNSSEMYENNRNQFIYSVSKAYSFYQSLN